MAASRKNRLWGKYISSLGIAPPGITMGYLDREPALHGREPLYRFAMIPMGLMRIEARAEKVVADARRGGFDRGRYVRALRELESARKKRLDRYVGMLKDFRRLLRESPGRVEVFGRQAYTEPLGADAEAIGKYLARVRRGVDRHRKELRSEIMKRQGIRKHIAAARELLKR